MGAKSFCKELGAFWRTIILFGVPLVTMAWPIAIPTPEVKTAFVLIIMGSYWMTEVIPLAVTSLIPVVLFPMLGIMKSSEVCPNYMKDTIMLFVGGLMVAVAVEKSNLHKRIALRVITLVGGKPRWLMLGFMLPTWFLSMWISNTATTAMMVPIVEAVLIQLRKHPKAENDDATIKNGKANVAYVGDEKDIEMYEIEINKSDTDDTEPSEDTEVHASEDLHHKKMCKALSLCICYSATVGGIATITGTGPNLVLKGQADLLFESYGISSGVNFSTWMVFGLPVSAIVLIISWLWLQFWFLGCCKSGDCACCGNSRSSEEAAKEVIRKEYEALGPIRFDEVAVLCHFVILALLWFTRHPEFVDGWDYIFPEKYLSDATPAIIVSLSLFMFPASKPNFFCCRSKDDKSKPGPRKSLLDWNTVSTRLPWGVVLLLGGGFAMADGCRESGLSAWVGDQLIVLKDLPPWAMVMLITLITATFTEATSNTATATLLLPIIAELAIKIEVNPLYLMLPTCLATSFAFMLPGATPPNAIVFGYGHLRVIDMAMAGFAMNVICVLVVTLGVETWGKAFFNLDVLPDAFKTASINATELWNTTTMNPCVAI